MAEITVSLAAPQVALVGGRGGVTASVTSATAERVVVGVVRPVGGDVPAAEPAWASVERPLRALAAGATEQFVIAFAPPAGTAPGTYEAKVVAYPADAAPEEYADRGQVVRLAVPPTTAPPPARRRFRWWPWVLAGVAVLAALAVAVVLLTREDAPPPPPDEPLDLVGAWDLIEGTGPDGAFAPVPGAPVTLVVTPQGEVSGSTGCNGYFGTVAVAGNTVTFSPLASTLRLCIGPVGETESAFLAAIRQVSEGERADTELTLRGGDSELTFALAD